MGKKRIGLEMTNGKVSIIIPFYNSASFLQQTLDSISSQTYKNWECVFIDDGSSDHSVEIIKKAAAIDDRFVVAKRPDSYPKGGNSCRNYGFEISCGEFVQWFDSDDVMQETMLEAKINVFREDSTLNYVICKTGYFSTSLDKIGSYEQSLRTNNLLPDYLRFKTKFFTPGPMFKKAFLQGMTLFNVDLKRHQEKEFFFRVILKNSNYGVVDRILVFRRLHDSSLSVTVDVGLEKTKARLLADAMMFNAYRQAKIKSKESEEYFKITFLRYAYVFAKSFSLLMMFKSLSYYAKAVLTN